MTFQSKIERAQLAFEASLKIDPISLNEVFRSRTGKTESDLKKEHSFFEIYHRPISDKLFKAYKAAITNLAPPFDYEAIDSLIELLDTIEGDSDFEFEHDDLGCREDFEPNDGGE